MKIVTDDAGRTWRIVHVVQADPPQWLLARGEHGQRAAQDRITDAFDRPTPFTKRAVAIQPARKQTLVASVFVKDQQAEYLSIQETGGTRIARTGDPIQPPVGIRTNVYGNIPRGAIKRELAKPRTFVARRSDPKTAHLPPGIYQRYKRSRRSGSKPPKMLVAFQKRATYEPIFRFGITVRQAVAQNVERRWRESLTRALQTMKIR